MYFLIQTMEFTLDTYAPGYVQYDDTFIIVTSRRDLFEYDPVSEDMKHRGDFLSQARAKSFALLIDGSILNCV